MGKNNRNQLKSNLKSKNSHEKSGKFKFLTFSTFEGSKISVFCRSFQKWSQILSKSKHSNSKTKKSNPKKLSFFKLLSTKKSVSFLNFWTLSTLNCSKTVSFYPNELKFWVNTQFTISFWILKLRKWGFLVILNKKAVFLGRNSQKQAK